ncbi:HAMP domain-containing sensor histidine kinase [Marinobacter lutaoensis]|jgi:signal transduction histidine kinase|uniref:ATP-binding protein n=1 Tax=Marinobacter lutaoensis TaxID=135739 RepID=A0A1V2DPK6_9GAMM|nr:HAMP domain-containing sensor histidine kinase [Marinobacter lutaoensis]MBI41958.1 sensor histidine kinase [Oceanospirillales bacterium]NVD36546.1 HAMP domain-containing histidine kinase [Marinobacter lutaoensis]ONF42459.1 ATP-binding protein [Marinobacter lutaoensis]|tara:strand:+ start:3857 stop:4546 length:690 start_codon:yes stop_codon:yes gene_type:complete
MSDENKQNIDFSMVLASAVHDMKNSLGMLLNSLDELRTEYQDSLGTSKRFNTLHYEAERMHNDLVQLLGIYRLGENNLSAHIDEHFVPDFLNEHLARHTPLLEGLGIQYQVASEDISGFFDEDLLTGVLNNTINNAIRYTRTLIRLTAREEDGYLVIGVEDDGQGYPESMQHSGTLSFKSLDFKSGSTSLGLFFASSVAKLHTEGDRTGFIRLRNGGSLGGGVFEIWLP